MESTDLSSLLVSLISLFLSTTLGLYIWTRRNNKGAQPLAIILFSESFWISGFVFEMLSGSLEARVFWDLFQWLFGPILGLALFELSSSLNKPTRYEKLIRQFLFSISFLIVLLVLTNPLHGLVISDPKLIVRPTGSVLFYEYSTLDYLITAFAYGVVLISFIRFISLPAWGQKIYRLQISAILTSFGIIVAGSFLPLLNVTLFWDQRDISPVTFGLSNMILAGGLFSFYLFDVSSLARKLVADTIDAPMVVVDAFDQIVDFNHAAQSYFDFSTTESGPSETRTLSLKWNQLFERFSKTQSFKGEVSIQVDEDQRVLDVTISAILDERNLLQGRLFFIRDITERKQIDERIRESEESYTRLFHTVKEAIYILSSDGVFLDVNEGAVKMYGYPSEEFIGKTPAFVSAVGKNDLKELSNILDRVFRSGISEEFEFWGKRKNGDEFPKECIANKGRYFGQDVIITTARDVSERKWIERKLHEHAEDMSLINTLNNALNRGESIESVIKTLSDETRRMFACDDVGLNLVSDNEEHLIMQYTSLSNTILKQLEAILGRQIPPIHIPIKETKIFKEVLETGRSILINDPQTIQSLIYEYSLTASLGQTTRTVIQTLIPQIAKLINFKSTILVPLLANGNAIGVLGIAGHNYFTENDLKRAENFCPQITIAIQRKRVEAKLRENEEKFRRLLTSVPDAVLGIDEAGSIIFANEEATHLVGYSHEELIYKNIDLLLPEHLRDIHSVNRSEYLAQPHVRHMGILSEPVVVRSDGFEVPVDIKLGYSESDSGLIVIVYIRDITERKQAEATLRESENKFRSVIEHASDGIALINKQGDIIEWNPAMERITGLNRLDVLSQPIWDIVFQMAPSEKKTREFQEENANQWLNEVKNQFANKDLLAEYVIQDPQGERKTIQSNGFSVETTQGTLGGVIMRDITARKQIEIAMQESEKRFRMLFDTAMDGIILTKPGGTIHSANPAALALLGYTESEIKRREREELIDTSDPQWKPAWDERDRTGSVKCELSFIRKDGSRFPAELNSVLFQQEDLFASTFFRDITQRKTAETEHTRLVTELKNKNVELERFSYAVSHDLKAPLFTIQGFLGYLERDILANNPEKIHSDLNRIKGAIEKMQRLLNELLELSRIGRMMNAPQQVALGVIANDAVNLVAGRITEKQVMVDIASDLPTVYCDRVRITQVLQNLIDNAVKFMGKGLQPQIWIGQQTIENQLVFFVRDNGMGILPEYQNRIFGLFDKLDATAEGTGVGLALVQRIIETHGGKIWVESEGADKGATFYFTLPMDVDSGNH